MDVVNDVIGSELVKSVENLCRLLCCWIGVIQPTVFLLFENCKQH